MTNRKSWNAGVLPRHLRHLGQRLSPRLRAIPKWGRHKRNAGFPRLYEPPSSIDDAWEAYDDLQKSNAERNSTSWAEFFALCFIIPAKVLALFALSLVIIITTVVGGIGFLLLYTQLGSNMFLPPPPDYLHRKYHTFIHKILVMQWYSQFMYAVAGTDEAEVPGECYDSSDSESDLDQGESYYTDRYDELVGYDDSPRGNDKWTYLSRSNRGGEVFGSAPKRNLPQGKFQLKYNPTSTMLLDEARMEVEQSLTRARERIFGIDDKQPITAASSFAAVLPESFWKVFHKYLKTGLKKKQQSKWTFQNILTFFKCEVYMRLYSCSANELTDFNVPDKEFKQFKKVRAALTKADVPPSDRQVVGGGSKQFGNTFDPILEEVIDACNKHWTHSYYVSGVSKMDVDDDKIPNSSLSWKRYGMKLTPTKDKKLKPVFHVMALIGAGYIMHISPDKYLVKLVDMLEKAIKHVSPSGIAAERATIAFFIDRGYLELAQNQGVNVTNLIQLMEKMGVKYLGTVKDSPSFPFQIVDLKDESSKTESNSKPILQAYGGRTSYKAQSGNKTAAVLRHGNGKIRGARVVTNMVEASTDSWAYETDREMSYRPHDEAPADSVEEDMSVEKQIDRAWKVIFLLLLENVFAPYFALH